MFISILRAVRPTLLGVAVLMVPALLAGCSRPDKSVAVFEDVTAASGLESYRGMTHGVAWGDFDGDGLPDLYVTNHLNGAKLYRNLGKGRFADVTDKFFRSQDLSGDNHGAAWADFDNDGRLDLIQLTGAARGVGTEAKRLFHNLGTGFEDVAEAAGVSNAYGRTRMPLWVDFNRDGQLDLFQGAETRFDDRIPPFTFIQHNGKFTSSDALLKFGSRNAPFCILTELDNDIYPELVCRVSSSNLAYQIFDTATAPARALDNLFQTSYEDIAAGDFDSDGAIDLFLTRKNPPGPIAFGRPSDNEFIADAWIGQEEVDKPLGFSFRSAGKLVFQVASTTPLTRLSPNSVHIGSNGTHPSKLQFALTKESAGVAGTASYQPGGEVGVFIGFAPPDKWQVLVSGARQALGTGNAKHQEITVKVTSSDAVADLQRIDAPMNEEAAPARLFMNRSGKLVEESEKRGVNKRLVSGVNVVAGDFNNDMYLDLFVVASGDVGKQENLLLLNRGDGHFDVVRAAGGAAGSRDGVGDSVTTADFDGDGFLDLLVTTGGSMGRSLGLPSEKGGYHLYRNIGNGNHWLEIDLQGTVSNRDGIGARVELTAGGVTQVRVQDGGVHERGQNHQRLHFGLAKFTQIDKIKIRWPSGMVQELNGAKADRILRIKEPAKQTGLSR